MNHQSLTHIFKNGLPNSLLFGETANPEQLTDSDKPFLSLEAKISLRILEMFVDENGQDRTPTLHELVPRAKQLAALTSGNVRDSLVRWIDAPSQIGRAYNIKQAAMQLAEQILSPVEVVKT